MYVMPEPVKSFINNSVSYNSIKDYLEHLTTLPPEKLIQISEDYKQHTSGLELMSLQDDEGNTFMHHLIIRLGGAHPSDYGGGVMKVFKLGEEMEYFAQPNVLHEDYYKGNGLSKVLELRPNLNIKNNRGNTPIHTALQDRIYENFAINYKNYPILIQYAAKSGFNFSIMNDQGQSVLHSSIIAPYTISLSKVPIIEPKNLAITPLISKAKNLINLNQLTEKNQHPLDFAIQNRRYFEALKLCNAGVSSFSEASFELLKENLKELDEISHMLRPNHYLTCHGYYEYINGIKLYNIFCDKFYEEAKAVIFNTKDDLKEVEFSKTYDLLNKIGELSPHYADGRYLMARIVSQHSEYTPEDFGEEAKQALCDLEVNQRKRERIGLMCGFFNEAAKKGHQQAQVELVLFNAELSKLEGVTFNKS